MTIHSVHFETTLFPIGHLQLNLSREPITISVSDNILQSDIHHSRRLTGSWGKIVMKYFKSTGHKVEEKY